MEPTEHGPRTVHLRQRRRDPLEVPRVVVGVGESPSGTAALAWAHQLCRSHGWRLDVVVAWPDLGEVPVHEIPGHYCLPRGRALAALHKALAECGVETDGPMVRAYIENADPVEALVDHSRGAAFLVVGRSGRGRSRGAGHDPMSELCVGRAQCPVVVVDSAAPLPREQSARSTQLTGSRE